MNSTIVVLGNGFDIDLGLKTKFADFIGSSHFSKHAFTPLMNQILSLHDKDARWCDIEQVFRDKFISYQNNPSKEVYDDINYSWQLINKAWGIYLPEITELKNTIIKTESCAFKMLEHPKTTSLWYTFNYTSPYYLTGLKTDVEPTPVHGWFSPREQNPEGLMYRIPNELVIGIDSGAIQQNNKDIQLSHIIKTLHPRYEQSNFTEDLFKCNNVIIFGHSMGITDSDYFCNYLHALKNGSLSHRNIYIVTHNLSSMVNIEANFDKLGVHLCELKAAGHKISSAFTINGPDNLKFKELLTLL